MAEGYRVVPLDLTNAHEREPIVAQGTEITDVAIRQLAAGATLQIHVGEGSDAIDILGAGDAFECCPPVNTGLYYTNVAQPGVIAKVLVSFGGGVRSNQ